jgi:hypothetical protein
LATLLACGPSQLRPNEPAAAKLTQTTLEFPDTYLGGHATQPLDVTNVGGQRGTFTTSVDAPFFLDINSLTLGPGEGAQIQVHFAPASTGDFSATLHVGDAQVPVRGRGLTVPQCDGPTSCTTTSFDPTRAQCVAVTQPDGTSCQGVCLTNGTCASGACVGQQLTCDDANACTLDACNDVAGCVHEQRGCDAPADPCQRATCDPLTGCGVATLNDGELCAPDDCLRAQVKVCITGQCVARPRAAGTCRNQWVPLNLASRSDASLVYDAARGLTVLFGGLARLGGLLNETWTWDGAHWTQQHPAHSPPGRIWASLAYDSDRRVVVLFGGYELRGQVLRDDTWEWDGRDWTQRLAPGPMSRFGAAMTYDSLRHRTVLFGGLDNDDTWEWDGLHWTRRTPATRPPGPRFAGFAFDPVRGRAVLFGAPSTETWEWDGQDWAAVPSKGLAPWPSAHAAMTWNPVTRRCLLVGDGTWEWDGTQWSKLGTLIYTTSSITWDERRARAVLYTDSNSRTLEWDGRTWMEPAPLASPPALSQRWLLWDGAARRAVLMGVGGVPGDAWLWSGSTWSFQATPNNPLRGIGAMTYDDARHQVFAWATGADYAASPDAAWTWDGTTWTERRSSITPPARFNPGLAYDVARARVVLFGGESSHGLEADTWEWDGLDWAQRMPTASPSPRINAAMAYDVARSRLVLFGGAVQLGVVRDDTWEWDGVDWTQKVSPLPGPPGRVGANLAYDPSRQRVVLFGGQDNVTGALNDTWEWDGVTWTERHLNRSPPPRTFAGMTYDEVNGRMMLFGGGDDGTWVLLP